MVFSIMHSNWLNFFKGSGLKYPIKYKMLLDMYHRSKMPFFEELFTIDFLLGNSIQLYHTGVLTSVNGFFHNAPEFAGLS